MRFRIDLKIFLFIILFCFTKQIEVYVMIMIFAIIHEMGHLIAGVCVGMRPEKLEIMPYGVAISFKLMPKDYNKKIKRGNLLEVKKIFVAISGPVTNLIVIIICKYLKLNEEIRSLVIYSNLLLIIFNLISIYPLDGGRIIRSLIHIFLGKEKSEKYSNNISFITVMILTAIASVAIYAVKNISIFIIIIFLWSLYIRQDLYIKRREKIYKLLEKSIEITENK